MAELLLLLYSNGTKTVPKRTKMYLNGKNRRLGQDEVGTDVSWSEVESVAPPTSPSLLTAPVSISPLWLGGISLLALAFVLHGAKRAGSAVKRKGRAVRKALRA